MHQTHTTLEGWGVLGPKRTSVRARQALVQGVGILSREAMEGAGFVIRAECMHVHLLLVRSTQIVIEPPTNCPIRPINWIFKVLWAESGVAHAPFSHSFSPLAIYRNIATSPDCTQHPDG